MLLDGGKKYTINDIIALPEGERAELIDGEMYMEAGVREYWIIDSEAEKVTVYLFEEGGIGSCTGHSFRETIASVVIDGPELDFTEMTKGIAW